MAKITIGNGQTSGRAGRGVGTVFFFFFFAMGTLFLVLLGHEVWKQGRTLLWPSTPCTITGSAATISDSDATPYAFTAAYQYSWQGASHVGQQVRVGGTAFDTYRPVQLLLLAYPVGQQTTCRVNPAAPSEAVLRVTFPWIGFAVFLPLIFMAVGAFGIYAMWHSGNTTGPAAALSNQARKSRQNNRTVLVIVFVVFFLLGSGIFGGMMVGPGWHWLSARQWPSVPCRVEGVRLLAHRGDDSTSYETSILYAYTVDGHGYQSSAYGFFPTSSKTREAHAALASRYPVGGASTCYVDPRDPSRAVLNRDLSAGAWLGLIPLLFAVIGGYGLWWQWTHRAVGAEATATTRGAQVARVSSQTTSPTRDGTGTGGGPLVLQPAQSRLMRFIGLLIFALIWNGAVGAMGYLAVFRARHFEIIPVLFFSVFALVGIAVLAGAIYQFLGLFSPQPQVALAHKDLHVGQAVEGRWQVVGKVGTIRQLTLVLEGREEARYTRGTRTYTDRHVFYTTTLICTSSPQEMARGTFTLTVPAGAMPSFASAHNQLIWSLRVTGDIPRWPDIKEEYPLTILPAAPVEEPV